MQGEDKTSPVDPDVVAAEEFVRELRAEAEAERAVAENDASRSASDNACTPEQNCTTIAELLAMIENGPAGAQRDASGDKSSEGKDESTEGVAPDQ
jgi:hypothetical protein